ncbi:hypothetical protein JCM10207_004761 [Rhodosporidiobolus poonsookiae]
MPVPSFPPELIDLILVKLRLTCGNDDSARRSNGLAAALVCKAWQSLGVEVIWHTELYLLPNLEDDEDDEDDENDDSADSDNGTDSTEDQLGSFLALCTHLEVLSAMEVPWVDYEELALAVPRLQHLKHVSLGEPAPEHDWPFPLRILPQLAALPRLVSLTFGIELKDKDWGSSITPEKVLLRTTNLTVRVCPTFEAGVVGTTPFHLALFGSIDSSALRSLTLILRPVDLAVVDRIFRFQQLGTLGIVLGATEAALPLLDRVLQHAHAATSELCGQCRLSIHSEESNTFSTVACLRRDGPQGEVVWTVIASAESEQA